MSAELTQAEQTTTVVFGDTFALYDDQSFEEFITPLRIRLERNGIRPEMFAGKRCLDAGCGGGRASVLMAQLGAAEVVGVDLSETNVKTCRARAEQRGLGNCTFQQGTLFDLPFDDESFDVVWSNGVLHHTGDTDASLREITRVLRRGGWLWLYLYGSGGIHWYVNDWIRDLLEPVDASECIAQLRLQGLEIRRVAERIDNWCVPVLERYTIDDLTTRLRELGFEQAEVLARGTDDDTSERRQNASPEEIELMGEGDLRYFAQKTALPSGRDEHVLPTTPDGKGSPWTDGPAVTAAQPQLNRLRSALEALESARGSEAFAYRIMVCHLVHDEVRGLIEGPDPFDMPAFQAHLDEVAQLCETFAGLPVGKA